MFNEKNSISLTLILGNSLFLGACSSLEPDNPKGKTMYYTEIKLSPYNCVKRVI